MAYFLRSFVGQLIPLQDEEASQVNAALDSTFSQIAFEELWDAVVQNFVDLEQDVLHHAINDMMFGDHDWNHHQDARTLFGRRLANLLSSCRAYIDLSPRQLRMAYCGISMVENFTSLKSAAYDSQFSYRLMETLRNYTQHYGSPITGTHLDARRIDHPSGGQFRHVTAASINAAKLRDDPKVKASVRNELIGMEKLEVNKFAREYVEQLSAIHVAIREMATPSAASDRSIIINAIDRIRAIGNKSDFGAYLILISDGEERSRRALMAEPFDRLDTLRRRNASLQGLSSRYVSGELLGHHMR